MGVDKENFSNNICKPWVEERIILPGVGTIVFGKFEITSKRDDERGVTLFTITRAMWWEPVEKESE